MRNEREGPEKNEEEALSRALFLLAKAQRKKKEGGQAKLALFRDQWKIGFPE